MREDGGMTDNSPVESNRCKMTKGPTRLSFCILCSFYCLLFPICHMLLCVNFFVHSFSRLFLCSAAAW